MNEESPPRQCRGGLRGTAPRRAVPRALSGCLAAVCAVVLLGCDAADEAAVPDAAIPTAVGRDSLAPAAIATVAPTTRPTARPLAIAVRPVVAAIGGGPDWTNDPVWPGPWSPNGGALLAYRLESEDPLHGPVGRLGAVHVPRASGVSQPPGDDESAIENLPPALAWESGDVAGAPGRWPLGAWRTDGSLALARADRPLVDDRGVPVAGGVDHLPFTPRTVAVGPNGRSVLWLGDHDAWLLSPEGVVRPITGLGQGLIGGWHWRFDGGGLALSVAGAGYYSVNVGSGQATLVARAPAEEFRPPGPLPPARWLADGRLLLPVPVSNEGMAGLELGVADPVGDRSTSLARLLDLGPNPAMPRDASDWVSADGRYVLFPEVQSVAGVNTVVASWIWPVLGDRAAQLLPPLSEPLWSPNGQRFTAIVDGAMVVFDLARPDRIQELNLVEGAYGVSRAEWSLDGRWLVFADASDGAWLVAADGSAGPGRIDAGERWRGNVSWSPDGQHLAIALESQDGATRLSIVSFGLEP